MGSIEPIEPLLTTPLECKDLLNINRNAMKFHNYIHVNELCLSKNQPSLPEQ